MQTDYNTESKYLYIKTYGCQSNVYDSLRIQTLLQPLGFNLVEKYDNADLIILNTCHIRDKATQKLYSELGRIKKSRRDKIKKTLIVVAGCVSQAEGSEIFSQCPFVDIIVGPQSYHNLPEMVKKAEAGEKRLIKLDFVEEAKFDNLAEEKFFEGSTIGISIQEGCDKFCSFCVVPYTRGREFSRSVEQIYREVLNAVTQGAKEIILLGQNVNAFHGKDYTGTELNLAKLINKLAKIKDLQRIRYTTSHPLDMDDELISLHGSEQKLMPFLHLPVQSGSNKVLKDMNRKYTTEHYYSIVENLRKANPNIVLSSDFIVGFPGETDEEFAETLTFVKTVKFGQCYSFKYSPRLGTPGALKLNQIPEKVKTERLIALQKELNKQQLEFNQNCIGKTMPVLFDRAGRFNNQIQGKTPYMQSVYINSDHLEGLLGKIVNIKVTQGFANSLTGEIIYS